MRNAPMVYMIRAILMIKCESTFPHVTAMKKRAILCEGNNAFYEYLLVECHPIADTLNIGFQHLFKPLEFCVQSLA